MSQTPESDPRNKHLREERDLLRALLEGGYVHHQLEPFTRKLLTRKREWLQVSRMCMQFGRKEIMRQCERN